MKVTNFGLVNIVNALQGFAHKKLPQKISYAITRNIMIFQKDYDCYIESLKNIFSQYEEHFVKNESGECMYNDNGIPIVDSEVSQEFNEEIAALLNIEIEINPYYISEDVFDYDDIGSRYDTLSAMDIMNLQSILCNQEEGEKDEVSK